MSDSTRERFAAADGGCISAVRASCAELVGTGSPSRLVATLAQEESDLHPHADVMWLAGPAVVFENGDAASCAPDRPYHYSGGCGPSAPRPAGDKLAPCSFGEPAGARVIAISQHWGEGYFHMMVEELPRLAQAWPHTAVSVCVHIKESAQARELLGLLGFACVLSGTVGARDAVIFPPPTPCGGHRYSLHASRLRAVLVTRLAPRAPDGAVVLIRRDGRSRHIVNSDALAAGIRASGRVVREHTGAGSLRDQLLLFASAGTVVGPHGAGLSNMVMMRQGGAVVELQVLPANHCYMLLAFNLGLRYSAHYEQGARHDGSWGVDVPAVLALLR